MVIRNYESSASRFYTDQKGGLGRNHKGHGALKAIVPRITNQVLASDRFD